MNKLEAANLRQNFIVGLRDFWGKQIASSGTGNYCADSNRMWPIIIASVSLTETFWRLFLHLPQHCKCFVTT